MSVLVRWFVGVGLVLALFIALVVGYLYYRLPNMGEAPKAAVVSLPLHYATRHSSAIPAYDGEHPRLAPRPAESYTFPIPVGAVGPVQPLFAGENQYPFYCENNSITSAQPLVDNHRGVGVPVFALDKQGQQSDSVVGYSKDCSHPTSVHYYYLNPQDQLFYPYGEQVSDGEVARVQVMGKDVPFIVRVEVGTINRFYYLIAALRGEADESLEKPSGANWNRRLVYQFRGGVGIGRRQGKISIGDLLYRRMEQLQEGYALVYSTANQTRNHYNIWLAEDTALRVKKQFVGRYGKPDFTIGIGGSGGAIQQYLLAQNSPGLLDGLIPLYSFPDMVSKTIHIFDCEPLEYYFDVLADANPKWEIWENRSLVEGLNASSTVKNRLAPLSQLASIFRGKMPPGQNGASECVQGWRGLTALVHNPVFAHISVNFAPRVVKDVKWTHWEDLYQFYGRDREGYANSPWDNEGVQYGLAALRSGQLSIREFLDINARVGGWKAPRQFADEKLWLLEGKLFPLELSPWSEHNMTHSGRRLDYARRTHANLSAIEGAYKSGLVFLGFADVPILDVRHYLENELDMHHMAASFSARLRLQHGQGFSDNHKIWVTHRPHDPSAGAIRVMDKWLSNYQRYPGKGLVAAQPPEAQDSCFDENGALLATGNGVWDGSWNGREAGPCSKIYPRFSNSREVAGDNLRGDTFKCQLMPVEEALSKGLYGDVDMVSYRQELENIFPDGVCDFTRPGVGYPSRLLARLKAYDSRSILAGRAKGRTPLVAEPTASGSSLPPSQFSALGADHGAAKVAKAVE